MFDCRDIPGDALHTPHFDANKAMGNIDCAIVMFDLTKASTQDNVEHWYRESLIDLRLSSLLTNSFAQALLPHPMTPTSPSHL